MVAAEGRAQGGPVRGGWAGSAAGERTGGGGLAAAAEATAA